MDNIVIAKDIVDKIRKISFNCDLAIAYARSEIQVREAEMRLYEHDSRKKSQRKFLTAKIDKERYEVFVADMEQVKTDINENLDIILSKYKPKYSMVFTMYFIENKSYEEISTATNYSLDAVKWIIKKLKNDLIAFYIS